MCIRALLVKTFMINKGLNLIVFMNYKIIKLYILSSGDVFPKNTYILFISVLMFITNDYFDKAEKFHGFCFKCLCRNFEADYNGL